MPSVTVLHGLVSIFKHIGNMSEYGIGIRRLAKKHGLSIDKLAMADLVAVGWSPVDAWHMCLRTGLTWDSGALEKEANSLVSSEAFVERISAVKKSLSDAQLEKFVAEREGIKKRDLKKKTSKDSLLQDLLAARENVKPGTLDYAKMTMQIADLTNAKKEETVKEDTTVHYFLPMKCSSCELYNKFISEKENGREQS